MKKVNVFTAALVALASFPLIAQQADTTAQQGAGAGVNGTHVSDSSSVGGSAQVKRQGAQVNGSGSADAAGSAKGLGSVNGAGTAGAEMRPVNTELVGKLDSKTAKTGDQVVVKTTEATKTADGTVIPKGTRLVGHVTSVQAHGKGSEDSQMGIQFDHAELKGGQNMAIQSEIRSVAPSASAMAMSSMQSDDSLAGGGASGRAMGGAAMGGGRMGGGGLLGGGSAAAGGLAGGSVRTVGETTGRAGSGLGATADDTARTSGYVAGRAGMTAGATAHATGVRGVMLAGDASGRASGMLSASKQNVHLDSGTQMTLGVAGAR